MPFGWFGGVANSPGAIAAPALSTADQIARYQTKAQTVIAAWSALFGSPPSLHALILSMAVAEFETQMGDARGSFAGEKNWGALHRRALTGDEAAILLGHGVFASGGAAALQTARGLLRPRDAGEALHIDHSGALGAYFVWFWAFASDADAARKFLEVLVRGRVATIIDTATADELAAAMYAAHYFEGFTRDAAAEIRNYGANVGKYATAIAGALGAGGFEDLPIPPAPQGPPSDETIETAQRRGGLAVMGLLAVLVAVVIVGRR